MWCANTNATVQRTQYYPSGLPWTYNAGDNPLGSQERKFNGKEFVEMHGYDTYDYGARGYYPAIGRFMSVDPLAEKYYSISPYAYCAGNPVKYIDPNGMDWFQNNQTGAVVYVSNLHQGAEKGMEKGWQWMGKNDMFKSDKNDIANSDQTLALKNGGNFKVIGNNPLTHNDDQVVVSMSLEGDKATKFMSDRGFDFKPTQQIRLESEIDIHLESGATAVTGEKTYITEKSVYVPHGSIEDGYTPLNDAKFGPISSVNRFQISYTDNIIKKGLNSLMPYIGYHDQRIPVVYPSLNSYPGNNELINIFLKTAKR